MKQLEIELKTLVSKENYLKLCAFYQLTDNQFHTQTNIYFDTSDRKLQKQKCALRIRRYADYGELTLKSPQTVGLLETTDTLTLAETNRCIQKQLIFANGTVANELQKLNIEPNDLLVLANLTTRRAEFSIEEGLLALDESWYNQQHDYELELEVTDATKGKIAFENYLKQHELPFLPAESKIMRAVRSVT